MTTEIFIALTPALATPANFAGAQVAVLATEAKVTGTNTDFKQGMPLGSAPTGGAVLPGDILVLRGIPYNIIAVASLTELQIDRPIVIAQAVTTDWFIVRSDVIRTPQAYNTVFGSHLWGSSTMTK